LRSNQIQDAFWMSMALTIMFGLLVGTVVTLVLVATFHATLNRISAPEQGTTRSEHEPQSKHEPQT
jgi:hypothetical protein